MARLGKVLRQRWFRDGDRGSSIAEALIIVPLAFIMIMAVIQYGLLWHGRHVAQAAAQAAVHGAAGYRADAATGQADADSYLTQVAPNLLPNFTVTVNRAATQVSVTVQAQVLTIVPFADFHLTETAAGPVEVFTPPDPP